MDLDEAVVKLKATLTGEVVNKQQKKGKNYQNCLFFKLLSLNYFSG
jgi:hypothetical protein